MVVAPQCLAALDRLPCKWCLLQVSEQYASKARGYWQKAGLEGKIDLKLGLASESLEQLLQEGRTGTYDFAFIDAGANSCHDLWSHARMHIRVLHLLHGTHGVFACCASIATAVAC